jgi:hypothetical protein
VNELGQARVATRCVACRWERIRPQARGYAPSVAGRRDAPAARGCCSGAGYRVAAGGGGGGGCLASLATRGIETLQSVAGKWLNGRLPVSCGLACFHGGNGLPRGLDRAPWASKLAAEAARGNFQPWFLGK